MIRTDTHKVRQGLNLGDLEIVGVVNHNAEQYYIINDYDLQSTDHVLIGQDPMLDDYVLFFGLVE